MVTTSLFLREEQFAQTEGAYCPSTTQTSNGTEVVYRVLAGARSAFEDSEQIFQRILNDMSNLISDKEGIPRSPSALPTLLIPERLLFTIKTYVYS